MTDDHTHPELEASLKFATGVLLDIRGLLDTRLGAMETRFGALEVRFGALETRFAAMETRFTRIERILDERLGRNGANQ